MGAAVVGISAEEGAVDALLCLEDASAEDAFVKLEPPLPLDAKSVYEVGTGSAMAWSKPRERW
jgi:hypothetical protein